MSGHSQKERLLADASLFAENHALFTVAVLFSLGAVCGVLIAVFIFAFLHRQKEKRAPATQKIEVSRSPSLDRDDILAAICKLPSLPKKR